MSNKLNTPYQAVACANFAEQDEDGHWWGGIKMGPFGDKETAIKVSVVCAKTIANDMENKGCKPIVVSNEEEE